MLTTVRSRWSTLMNPPSRSMTLKYTRDTTPNIQSRDGKQHHKFDESVLTACGSVNKSSSIPRQRNISQNVLGNTYARKIKKKANVKSIYISTFNLSHVAVSELHHLWGPQCSDTKWHSTSQFSSFQELYKALRNDEYTYVCPVTRMFLKGKKNREIPRSSPLWIRTRMFICSPIMWQRLDL